MCETKICKRCEVERNSISDFRGRNVCRDCEKAKRSEHNKTLEHRAKKSAYRRLPDQKAKAKALKQKPEYVERSKAYKKEYRKTDAYKDYMRVYRKTEGQVAYMSAYHKSPVYKAYMQTDEYRARAKSNKEAEGYIAHIQSVEYKEKAKDRKRRPDQKAKAKDLKQKPEYKAKQKIYQQEFGGSHYRRAEKRGNHSERVRRIDIFRRDNFICEYCKKRLEIGDCVLDHRIPIVRGGSNTPENCTTSCDPCNSKKNSKLINGAQITIFDKVL